MENQDFKISIKTVWILVIGNFFMTIIAILAKIQNWSFSQMLITIGLMLFFSAWIVVLSDMFKNTIYNKTFWIASMFIMPTIASVIYLVQRNRLLRLGQKIS